MRFGHGRGNIRGRFSYSKPLAREVLTELRFGTIALVLQLVPVASMFFLLTTACGSALWVIKLEEQKRLISEAPVVDEEAPPVYTDDPI